MQEQIIKCGSRVGIKANEGYLARSNINIKYEILKGQGNSNLADILSHISERWKFRLWKMKKTFIAIFYLEFAWISQKKTFYKHIKFH